MVVFVQFANMKITFLLCLLFSFASLIGQKETIQDPDTVYHHEKGMLIIPFEKKMYRSQIDKELAEENEKNFPTILSNFRNGVAYQFKYQMLYRYKAFSIFNLTIDSLRGDLERIYAGVGYTYEVIIDTAGYSEANPLEKLKLDKKIKAAKNEPVSGTINGEIVSTRDTRKKYMKTAIKDTSLLPYLNERYQCSYYLFINELDLMNDLSDINAVSTGEWNRLVKIHFTVISSNGKTIESGVLEKPFPRDKNNIDKIISEEFKALATQLRHKMSLHEQQQAMLIQEKDNQSLNELKPVKRKIISAKKRIKNN